MSVTPARIMTVDLEDWFHSTNVRPRVDRCAWDALPSSLPRNTEWLLSLFDKAGIKATFFVLGWIAEKYPDLVRRISGQGHEIACHGFDHTPLSECAPEQFRHDMARSVTAISVACGATVQGFRAPAFSLQPETFWALDILAQMGFSYDSSMVSIIRHPDYGIRGFPREPFRFRGLIEIPVPDAWGFPVGGAYFRLFPYWMTRLQLRTQSYSVFYLHPWELADHPVPVRLPVTSRFRHTVGLAGTCAKLETLLQDFRFVPISAYLRDWGPALPPASLPGQPPP